jgi:hypothetical protein
MPSNLFETAIATCLHVLVTHSKPDSENSDPSARILGRSGILCLQHPRREPCPHAACSLDDVATLEANTPYATPLKKRGRRSATLSSRHMCVRP